MKNLMHVVFFLIKTCTDVGADRLKIDQNSVTLSEQPYGDWEIIVRKKDAKD